MKYQVIGKRVKKQTYTLDKALSMTSSHFYNVSFEHNFTDIYYMNQKLSEISTSQIIEIINEKENGIINYEYGRNDSYNYEDSENKRITHEDFNKMWEKQSKYFDKKEKRKVLRKILKNFTFDISERT